MIGNPALPEIAGCCRLPDCDFYFFFFNMGCSVQSFPHLFDLQIFPDVEIAKSVLVVTGAQLAAEKK